MEKKRKEKEKPVAQRQEMVSGTLALLCGLPRAAFYVSRALALKGDKVLWDTGGICTSICPLLKGSFLGALIGCLEAGQGLLEGLSGLSVLFQARLDQT